MSFQVGSSGTIVSCEVEVQETAKYAVLLEYIPRNKTPEEWKRIKELLGEPVYKGDTGARYWTERKTPIQVQATIALASDPAEEPLSATIEPAISYWGSDALYAELISADLRPGVYRISARSMRDAPELSNITTNIVFRRAYIGN